MFLFKCKQKELIQSKQSELLGSSQLLGILQNVHESIFCLDIQLNYLYINPAYIKLTSYNETDLIGHSFLEAVIVKEDIEIARDLINEGIKNGMSQGILVGRNKSNVGLVMKTRIIKRVNELNEIIGVFGFVT